MSWLEGIIDISHWQVPVNFAAFKNGGGLGVILKATQGTGFVDPTFTARFHQATLMGLLVGAYHFADASDPMQQAMFFARVAGPAPLLALDIEPNGTGQTVSITQAAEIISYVQSLTGKLPLVYIGRYGPSGSGIGLPNAVLSRCPLWLPEYGSNPIPPRGFGFPMLWQYTATGAVAGIGGPCDRNRFNGTEEQLRAFWQ
jgi:lysozyme